MAAQDNKKTTSSNSGGKGRGRKGVKKGILRDTVEVIEFGHPKRAKRLVTLHSYEPVQVRTIV
jgi:hypothetical protein